MDYKNTVNLPRTDFPMKADLVSREPQRLAKWTEMRLYERIQAARVDAPKFVLHDGPPFANGDVHVGTALNKILKDIIVKYKTVRGFSAPYIPGWDCHGLPIEFKVSQEMRKAGNTEADPASIRRACDTYARKYIDLQRTQFKRLGVLGDWENPYLTLNREYEADELRLFADVVEKGFVYRGKKPVYWSIPCHTALAEAEVEYNDHVSQSIYVKFPVVGQPGTFILIWTTTPWTLPANLAVAFNSQFHYSLVMANDETYLVSNALLSQVSAKAGWDAYQIIRTVYGDELATLEYQHPFCNRTGKLLAGDDFVENTTGTGFVHIAPGHGLEDYSLGIRHGLPVYSPVDDTGCLARTSDLPVEQQMPDSLVGKSVLEKGGKSSDANEAVLAILRESNRLLVHEPYTHQYPHCWRSKTPVVFRAMDQWFIRIDHATADGSTFRKQALAEIDRVQWVPDWGINRIRGAVEGRPDWCISRQRSWGVPIPAFYDAQGNAILDARVVRRAADLVQKEGSHVWFEKTPSELWALCRPSDWTGAEGVSKSADTLDVWIDSGSSSRAVIAQRGELHGKRADGSTLPAFQADLYLEGSDQHRGWFQSSLLLSLAGNGAAPFRTVLTHGFMVDADREKISKSKQGQGGYEKPQTAERYVKDFGADVLRLWVASQDFRNDIVVSEERIKKVGETYRLIRNALRYQLSNLYDFDPAKHTVPDAQLTGLDRWILGEFAALEADVLKAYESFEFHVVYQRIAQFTAVELSSVYHDVVKDRLYTDAANSPRRRSTQTALARLVTGLCHVLSPILAFTADEAWEFIPGREQATVHESIWNPKPFAFGEVERALWQKLFSIRDLTMPVLEQARQAKTIGKALDARMEATVPSDWIEPLTPVISQLQELLNVSQLTLKPGPASRPDAPAGSEVTAQVVKADGAKCERCWHWETHVGQSVEHPTLCNRCVEAVKG
ncbi:MAG: isoleucine--tRNA ligase [Verrucomicrobiales bacterium]|nr:isoleucine--tRNA ligase [Verrucomicrobiales bacterium]